MERRLRRTYKVVNKIAHLDLATLEPREIKKISNSIRKAEYKINHVIDSLISISEPSPFDWLFSDLLFRKWNFYGNHFWKNKFFHWDDYFYSYDFDTLLDYLYEALDVAHEIDTLMHIYLDLQPFYNEHLKKRPYEYPSIYLPPELGVALDDSYSGDLEIPQFDYEAYTDYSDDEYETWHDDWFDAFDD